MVMEFLEGVTLADRMEAVGPMPPGQAIGLILQVLEALAASHHVGIVHRDLKPENILVLDKKAGFRDYVKVIDFGVSKFNIGESDSDLKMTATGAVIGTPYYLSPEQARGRSDLDGRSDIYAISVVLYEALAGRRPYDGTGFSDLLFKIVLEAPQAITEVLPSIDPELAALVMKGLEKKCEDRFQDADEFASALRDWAERHGVSTDMTLAGASRGQMASVNGLPVGTLSSSTLGTTGNREKASTPVAFTSTFDDGRMPALETSGVAFEGSSKKANPLWIGGAAVGVLALCAGAIFIFSGSDDEANMAAATTDESSVKTSETLAALQKNAEKQRLIAEKEAAAERARQAEAAAAEALALVEKQKQEAEELAKKQAEEDAAEAARIAAAKKASVKAPAPVKTASPSPAAAKPAPKKTSRLGY